MCVSHDPEKYYVMKFDLAGSYTCNILHVQEKWTQNICFLAQILQDLVLVLIIIIMNA